MRWKTLEGLQIPQEREKRYPPCAKKSHCAPTQAVCAPAIDGMENELTEPISEKEKSNPLQRNSQRDEKKRRRIG
jgi:hypothetical protein